MADLVPFLKDRVRADEEAAPFVHLTDPECEIVFHATVDPTFGWSCTCGVPARIVAECAAKRRIIEWMADYEYDLSDGHWEGHGSEERWIADREPELLLILAAVYVGHPDFDPDWLQP